MHQDGRAVLGELDIELHPLEPQITREFQPRERVLRGEPATTTVGDDAGIGPSGSGFGHAVVVEIQGA